METKDWEPGFYRRSLKLKEWGRTFERTVPGIGGSPEHLLRTDADGYICTGNAYSGGAPVVILGDSFVECLLVPERLRFCSVVERILRAQGKAVCIKNAGMSGAHMMHHIFTLLAKIIPLHPKLIVLVIPTHDYPVSRHKNAYWSIDSRASIFGNATIKNDKLYRASLKRSRYRFVVESFIQNCKCFQMKCCFVARPLPTNKPLLRVKMQEMALGIAKDNRVYCIDFLKQFDPYIKNIFYDDPHLNAYGSALFGKYLAKALLEGHLL